MQYISIVHLHIFHLEIGLPVHCENASIILLSSLFRIEVGPVQQDTEYCVRRELGGGFEESGGMKYAFDRRFDFIEF